MKICIELNKLHNKTMISKRLDGSLDVNLYESMLGINFIEKTCRETSDQNSTHHI